MTRDEAIQAIRAAFPGLRLSEMNKFDLAMGKAIRVKRGDVTVVIGVTDRAMTCAVDVRVDGVEFVLSPSTHEGYDPGTFAARLERLVKAIDALTAARGGKRKLAEEGR